MKQVTVAWIAVLVYQTSFQHCIAQNSRLQPSQSVVDSTNSLIEALQDQSVTRIGVNGNISVGDSDLGVGPIRLNRSVNVAPAFQNEAASWQLLAADFFIIVGLNNSLTFESLTITVLNCGGHTKALTLNEKNILWPLVEAEGGNIFASCLHIMPANRGSEYPGSVLCRACKFGSLAVYLQC